MAKLLVEQEDQSQFLIEVSDSGHYSGIILWDDRKDGPLPEDALGPNLHGWRRDGAQLVFDADKFAAYMASKIPSDPVPS